MGLDPSLGRRDQGRPPVVHAQDVAGCDRAVREELLELAHCFHRRRARVFVLDDDHGVSLGPWDSNRRDLLRKSTVGLCLCSLILLASATAS